MGVYSGLLHRLNMAVIDRFSKFNICNTKSRTADSMNQLMVISGPSGVGKSTLLHRLLKEYPGYFQFSVSRELLPSKQTNKQTNEQQTNYQTNERIKICVAQPLAIYGHIDNCGISGTSLFTLFKDTHTILTCYNPTQ